MGISHSSHCDGVVDAALCQERDRGNTKMTRTSRLTSSGIPDCCANPEDVKMERYWVSETYPLVRRHPDVIRPPDPRWTPTAKTPPRNSSRKSSGASDKSALIVTSRAEKIEVTLRNSLECSVVKGVGGAPVIVARRKSVMETKENTDKGSKSRRGSRLVVYPCLTPEVEQKQLFAQHKVMCVDHANHSQKFDTERKLEMMGMSEEAIAKKAATEHKNELKTARRASLTFKEEMDAKYDVGGPCGNFYRPKIHQVFKKIDLSDAAVALHLPDSPSSKEAQNLDAGELHRPHAIDLQGDRIIDIR